MASQPPDLSERPDAHSHLVEVRVIGVPVDIYQRVAEHTDDLQREFALVLQRQQDTHDVPARLLRLIEDVQARFGAFSAGPRAALEQAVDRGEPSIDLLYRVPPEIKQACLDLVALLDEADEFCRNGEELLTLATPADGVAFRRWLLGEFVAQVDGEPPTPWSEWSASPT